MIAMDVGDENVVGRRQTIVGALGGVDVDDFAAGLDAAGWRAEWAMIWTVPAEVENSSGAAAKRTAENNSAAVARVFMMPIVQRKEEYWLP